MSMKLAAQRYAKALRSIGLQQNTLLDLQKELSATDLLVRRYADLERLVLGRLISPSKKAAAFDAILEKAGASSTLRKFFKVVSLAARLDLLHEIVAEFDALVDEYLGILNAAVTAARPMNSKQTQALEQSLTLRTGKKIRLALREDASLLGGLKVQLGSTIFDASLQGQLQQLKARMIK